MNANVKEKIVRDAVHGYIHIDAKYFQIIDTPNFQRLKRLEQTNARPVYPCAHHDRFVHSLGVFHLGKFAYRFLHENSFENLSFSSKTNDNNKKETYWTNVKTNFELACLLHDVGHAPFSHTFEGCFLQPYKIDEDNEDYLLNGILSGKEWVPEERKVKTNKFDEESKRFFEDYTISGYIGAQHEKVSAILVLTEYYDIITEELDYNPYLIARMILGLKYPHRNTNTKIQQKFDNCFIELLNSKTIDVDKLDYLARDQWATGHVSKMIDYERIFSSMYIRETNSEDDSYEICYHKRCINELYGLMETKKMIGVNMHSHHIVKYDEYVLTQAINDITKRIDKEINDDSEPLTRDKIFSLDSLNKNKIVKIKNLNFRFHLITDDDLISLLKHYIDESEYAKEWFNREYKLKAVWKTFPDYKYFFRTLSSKELNILYEQKEEIAKKFLSKNGYNEMELDSNFYCETKLQKEYVPDFSINVNIYIKEHVVKLNDLRDINEGKKGKKEEENSEAIRYFLLYLPKNLISPLDGSTTKRDEFIKFVIDELKKAGTGRLSTELVNYQKKC